MRTTGEIFSIFERDSPRSSTCRTSASGENSVQRIQGECCRRKKMNPFEMLQNTAKLKEEAEKMQNELSQLSATGSSGGKMVTVTVNGKMEMTAIHLDPVCVDNRDVKMLEDLIVAAHHDAITNMQEQIKSKVNPLLAGMNIPGL